MSLTPPAPVQVVQRWNNRQDRYRPAGELINTSAYEVAPLVTLEAKSFVERHHYSQSYPAARFRFGMYRAGVLVGVAVFSHPCSDKVLTSVFPGEATDSVELGRFVLLDSVPGNGETWFLARTFELLRAEELRGVVSFSDPLSRRNAAGELVTPGHVGTIYQAHNAVYLGQAPRRTIRLTSTGKTISARTISKVRRQEKGWRYAVEDLVEAGAPAPGADLTAWLPVALAAATTTVRHPGNHKYAWAFSRRERRTLPTSLPYPRKAA
jgi:hypothetical protein